MKLIRRGDMNQEVLLLLARGLATRRHRTILSLPGELPPPELVLHRPKLMTSRWASVEALEEETSVLGIEEY